MDEKYEVHSIYTDFCKAFDVVPFHLPIHKIKTRFGILNNELLWFQSYLENRFQRVICNGVESAWINVTSGVSQGSILGHALFLNYIDDFPDECQHSQSLLFADDNKTFDTS